MNEIFPTCTLSGVSVLALLLFDFLPEVRLSNCNKKGQREQMGIPFLFPPTVCEWIMLFACDGLMITRMISCLPTFDSFGIHGTFSAQTSTGAGVKVGVRG